MAKLPAISGAQWEVMNIIWAESPITAATVIQRLAESTGWNPRTIKTLINRLLKKGVITFEARGKEYLYRPLIRREQCVKSESRWFLDRVFGGAAGPMLVHFVNQANLTEAEIQELKQILSRKGK